MLETKKAASDRTVLVQRRREEKVREQYIVAKGNSKALNDIHVSYRVLIESANGDVFREDETVELSFDYPEGRTSKLMEFRASRRDYAEALQVIQGQEDVPADVLAELVDTMPLEVRRLLPALPK